jgi:Tfp pilus assembly protein PilF
LRDYALLLAIFVCMGFQARDVSGIPSSVQSNPSGASVSVTRQWRPERAASLSGFIDAKYCGRCHHEIYIEWRQSLHSNSFRTPFYRASEIRFADAKGKQSAAHCDRCHHPFAVALGALAEGSQVNHFFDGDGVTCLVCHSIQAGSNAGSGSYVMGIASVATDENGNRIPGPVPDSVILKYPERHRRAVMQDFYTTAEFCGTCHKAALPVSLTDDKLVREFDTYDEWQMSSFSGRNPLNFYTRKGATCQDCHMPPELATREDPGSKRGTFASHRWLAGNTAVPFLYGDAEQIDRTEEFLRSGDYLKVDLFGLKREGGDRLVGPLGSVPFSLSASDVMDVFVVVQNNGIGHSLLPEIRDLYEAWVEFSARDAGGQEIYDSGFIRPDGNVDERAHYFVNRPIDKDGNSIDNHDVWKIRSTGYDSTIPAGGSILVRYRFRIPANVRGPITITASVKYRHFRQSYLNTVLGADHPQYPIVQLASSTRTLRIGENRPQPMGPDDNPAWMRWNNLGIACLDRGSGLAPIPDEEYAQAIDAFSEVLKLRPAYADGYTNLALTYIQLGQFEKAAALLAKALALNPGNSRALYYRGLVEERTNQDERALADFRKVVGNYPQSRDARRELGTMELARHQYEDALQQFQALQQIDPDDLSAHFNLAILYRHLGMNSEAAEQEALYQAQKPDPAAPTYSFEYLRKHPEMVNEMLPWHVHTDEPSNGTETAH